MTLFIEIEMLHSCIKILDRNDCVDVLKWVLHYGSLKYTRKKTFCASFTIADKRVLFGEKHWTTIKQNVCSHK